MLWWFSSKPWWKHRKGRLLIKAGHIVLEHQRTMRPASSRACPRWRFCLSLQNTTQWWGSWLSWALTTGSIQNQETSPPRKPAPALHTSALFCAVADQPSEEEWGDPLAGWPGTPVSPLLASQRSQRNPYEAPPPTGAHASRILLELAKRVKGMKEGIEFRILSQKEEETLSSQEDSTSWLNRTAMKRMSRSLSYDELRIHNQREAQKYTQRVEPAWALNCSQHGQAACGVTRVREPGLWDNPTLPAACTLLPRRKFSVFFSTFLLIMQSHLRLYTILKYIRLYIILKYMF